MSTDGRSAALIRPGLDVSEWGEEGGCYSKDEGRKCRWSFERRWDEGPLACWIGLNPATGDSDKHPRRTLLKMVNWSLGLGCKGIIIVNLFAYRETHFRELIAKAEKGEQVVGEKNDAVIERAASRAKYTILAWGAGGIFRNRGQIVASRFPDALCLGLTVKGQPRHPLYARGDSPLVPYSRLVAASRREDYPNMRW